MTVQKQHHFLTCIIGLVWLVNGLYCKVLNLVPRHGQIVERILGSSFSRTLTVLIGLSEILLAGWIFTKHRSKTNALLQMSIVAFMNMLEFILAPDLLLWGKLNSLFALVFIGLVYYWEFVLNKKIQSPGP